MNKKKIAVVFGTRPDTIKMAPIILELQRNSDFFDVLPIATAQHRQMLDQVLEVFNIKPSYDLNIMAGTTPSKPEILGTTPWMAREKLPR